MKSAFSAAYNIIRSAFNNFLVLSIMLVSGFQLTAQPIHWTADTSVQLIDGQSVHYNRVQPGDTIYLKGENRETKWQSPSAFADNVITGVCFVKTGSCMEIRNPYTYTACICIQVTCKSIVLLGKEIYQPQGDA